jgi:hypothetical protein
VSSAMIAPSKHDMPVDCNSGHWREPWSPAVQARWVESVLRIAISKPYVDSVIWPSLMDHPEIELPLGGMVTEDLQPKPALKRYAEFRRSLVNQSQPAAVR